MKKSLFLMAALLVAMTGCQKEPQAAPENNGSNADAVGYVSLKISLPSATGTKAETFDDGLAEEYNVKDVTVVFYDENNKYVYHTAVDTKPWNNNTADDITVTGKTEAIKLEKNEAKQAKKALVLVNSRNFYKTEASYKDDFVAEKIGEIPMEEPKILYSNENAKNDYFFMSNAPVYNGDVFTTLVDVNVKDTEHDALNNPASVKVERAAAKVTVTADYGDGNSSWTIGENEYTATFGSWALNVTNKKFYFVRNGYDKTNKDWFDDSKNLINPGLIGSRIYWAVDPNYNVYSNWDFNQVEYDDDLTLPSGYSTYCAENTFDISTMIERATTTAMVSVKIQPVGGTAGENWFQVGTGKSVYTAAAFKTYIMDKTGIDEAAYNALTFKAGECGDLEITVDGEVKTLSDYVGSVICFANGTCYYPVKIRHFNNDELGYVNDDEFKASFINNGGYVKKDLGRYGVLRNTWYKLSIDGVSAPGSAEIPTPGTELDDKYEQFVACTIDILAWGVREHSVIL